MLLYSIDFKKALVGANKKTGGVAMTTFKSFEETEVWKKARVGPRKFI
jgi:hypothetical protein